MFDHFGIIYGYMGAEERLRRVALSTGLLHNQIRVWFEDRREKESEFRSKMKFDDLSEAQKKALEAEYAALICMFPTTVRMREMAMEINLPYKRVDIWFGRRYREEDRTERKARIEKIKQATAMKEAETLEKELNQQMKIEAEKSIFNQTHRPVASVPNNNTVTMNARIEPSSSVEQIQTLSQEFDQQLQINSETQDLNQVFQNIRCVNCSANRTSLWRSNSEGRTICSACYLYHKLHGVNREATYVPDDDTVTMVVPPYAIPQTLLQSFAPDGPDTYKNDNEEITEEQEMVFKKVLKRKMTCDTCKTNVKRFKCPGCLTSICKDCITQECANCGEEHTEFMNIVLPEM